MPKRRANGEGSIFKHSSGRWAAQYTDNVGKRRTLYGKTQHEVKEKLKEAIRQSDGGLLMDKGKISFVDWIYEWLEVYVKPTTRAGTYSGYYTVARTHIENAFPNILLKDLTTTHLQKFFNEKAKSGRLDGKEGGLSLYTLKNIKKVITGAMKRAMDDNIIAVDVSRKIQLPKAEVREPHILTRKEQQKLEQAIIESENPLSFAILLDLYTGLRIGELIGLKVEDIDYQKKELTIRRSISRPVMPEVNKTITVINEPKTAKGRRKIPLTDFIMERLKKYMVYRESMIEAMDERWEWLSAERKERWKSEEYLFVTPYGIVVSSTLRNILNTLLSEAGVQHTNFHALRHTFATRCMEVGFDIKSLSDILGHVDAKMTLNTYAHAMPEQKQENMDKLAQIFVDK